MRSRFHLAIVGLGLASILPVQMSACTLEETTDTPTTRGYLSVGLMDAPLDDVSEVWVTIEAFDVRICGGGWLNLPLSQSAPYDLLSYQNDIADLVPIIELPSENICELRLIVGDENYVVTNSAEKIPMKVPSSEVKFKGELAVYPAVHTRVVIDFDAEKSVHETGNGQFVLHPVVRIADVEYQPGNGAPLPSHHFMGSNTFEVHPWTDQTFDLGGGGFIDFDPGAVDDTEIFTVTRWQRPAASGIGEIYRFSPSYRFGTRPILTLPVGQNSDGVAVFIDNNPLPTQCAGGSCSAEFPHFSDGESCRNFQDTLPFAWYSHDLKRASCLGIIRGYDVNGAAVYYPEQEITRVDLLHIVARLAVADSVVDNFNDPVTFADVNVGDPFYKLVAWAVDAGVIDKSQTNFRPHDPINRGEAAAMFVRASKAFDAGNGSLAAESFADLHDRVSRWRADSEFADVTDTKTWFYRYVYAMRDAGLMHGYDDGSNKFGWNDPVTRAQAAVIACRAAGHCEGKSSLPQAPFAAPSVINSIQCINGTVSHEGALQYGIDYLMDVGTDIVASLPGTVQYVHDGCPNTPNNCRVNHSADCDCHHGLGNVVVLSHDEGRFYSVYGHLNSGEILVSEGQTICQGQILGKSGDSGWGTHPHLHFQIQMTAGGDQQVKVGYISVEFPGWYAPDDGMQPLCGDLTSYNVPVQSCEAPSP